MLHAATDVLTLFEVSDDWLLDPSGSDVDPTYCPEELALYEADSLFSSISQALSYVHCDMLALKTGRERR